MAVEQIIEYKKVLCVIASKGLMDHILPISPCPNFFINEMSCLITHVRFGTVIAYICGKYKKIGFIFVKITKHVDILGTCVDPFTPYKFQITQNIILCVYTIEMH